MSSSKVYSVHAQPDWMETLLSLRSNAVEDEQSIDVPGYSGEVLKFRAPPKSCATCKLWVTVTSIGGANLAEVHSIDSEIEVQCINHNPMLPLEERYILRSELCIVEWKGVCIRLFKEIDGCVLFDCLQRPCSIFKTPHSLNVAPTFESTTESDDVPEHVWNFERPEHPMAGAVRDSETQQNQLHSLVLKGKQSLSETTCIAVGVWGASGSAEDLRVWDSSSFQVRKVLSAVHPTRLLWQSTNVLCMGGLDGSVNILATESGLVVKSFHGAFGRVTCQKVLDRLIYSTHAQGAQCVWSMDGKTDNTVFGPGDGSTEYLQVAVQNGQLYCVHTYGVDVFNADSPQELPVQRIKVDRKVHTAVQHDDVIFLGDQQGYITVFDMSSYTFTVAGRVSKEGVVQLRVLDNGNSLLITSELHEVQKYQLADNKVTVLQECLGRVDDSVEDICVVESKLYLAGKEGVFQFE